MLCALGRTTTQAQGTTSQVRQAGRRRAGAGIQGGVTNRGPGPRPVMEQHLGQCGVAARSRSRSSGHLAARSPDVRNCGQLTPYEVVLLPPPRGVPTRMPGGVGRCLGNATNSWGEPGKPRPLRAEIKLVYRSIW
jgi:hypothetical protein